MHRKNCSTHCSPNGRPRTVSPALGVLAALVLGSTVSVVAAPSVALYRGEPSTAGGLQLGGWGSGEAVDTSREAYSGSHSIKLTTDGYYAGGRLTFRDPVDLTQQFMDPQSFLELTVKFLPGRLRTGPGGTFGAGSDYTSGGPAGYPGAGGAPAGYPGAPGGPGGGLGGLGDPTLDAASALLITPDTQRLRVVLVFDGGTAVAEDHPLIRFPTSEPSWVRVAIPFTQFKGAPRMASYRLREMRIFGDATDTFFIGQISTITDSEPISVEPLEEQVVAVNDRVEFVGSAEGGIAGLKFSWDFDKSDGIQEDAIGARVYHTYRKATPENRPYTVTLTVSDISGAKSPVSVEATVEVID
jgi:hypothetical protein